MTLRLHNSLSRTLEPFDPIDLGRVRMYTCGPTVYDRAHIGNFRAFLWEDLLRRYLTWKGYAVEQVMNITDVDDRTINAALERDLTLTEVTEPVIEQFLEDWAILGLEEPEHRPRATEYVPEMIALVESLKEKSLAYESDGSIYYRIAEFPGYGALAGIEPEGLESTGRATGDEEYDKDDPRDFVLWKGGARGKEGEVASWESPWGEGRPGWHLECSAMAMKILGETLDIHTGGVDNLFPHHTNEIAQSEGSTGTTFANYWLHGAHLLVEGQKMSKSLGNCYTIPELLERGYAPSAIRYLMLSGHYRVQLNFTFDGLEAATKAVTRLFEFRERVRAAVSAGIDETVDVDEPAATALTGFEAAMDDDLNVSEALAALFGLVRETNQALDATAPQAPAGSQAVLAMLGDFERVFGVFALRETEATGPDETLVEWAKTRVDDRERARAERDFAEADAIREELESKGVAVEDLADVTRLRLGPRTVVVPKAGK